MPKVSVILPVYNAEKYLAAAIDSILNQTFTDFELLLVNDGSTDSSETIIQRYNDPRIVYVQNEQNEGLIYSLNKAIDLARGEYIARMDADDIAMPARLEEQVKRFETVSVAVLATTVKLIDENDQPLPDWEDDVRHTSSEQIKRFLLKDNCVAHPTVLAKTELFRKYKYQYNQKYSEDYDLWLRVATDGLVIEKLEEPQLLHRILHTSATRFKKVNIFYRLAKVKFRFLWTQIKVGRFTGFHALVFIYAVGDLVKAAGKEVKQLYKK